MKTKWLIILILFIGLSAFNFMDTFDSNNPSVKIFIEDGDRSYKSGETIRFSIKVCSAYNLKTFMVNSDHENDKNSKLLYRFDHNTKQALINYFYTVPADMQTKNIQFKFKLRDNNKETEKMKKVSII